ncbi:MAG: HEAT repeat domain-containing protein [Candidatus Polarisedimenticolia bacterium]
MALYSADHPRGKEYAERAYDSLRRLHEVRHDVTLVRSGNRLFLDQVLLDRDRGLAEQLAVDLTSRQVGSLVLLPTLTPEEHLGLIRSLLSKPDRVTEKGGFDQVLLDEGVSSVKSTSSGNDQTDGPAETRLADLVVQLGRQSRAQNELSGRATSVTSFLGQDPAALAQAIGEAARGRESAAPSSIEALADAVADMLETLAERAIEEHQRDREEILRDLGRALVKADPDLHLTLVMEKAGPRSHRKNLVAAVDMLASEMVGDLVALHYQRSRGDHRPVLEMLSRLLSRRSDRQSVLVTVEQRLRTDGIDGQDARDLVDQVIWSDLTMPRRLQLLSRGQFIWRADFSRVKDVLTRLYAADQPREASAIIQTYFEGLSSPELDIRRAVADNTRHILQMLEKTGRSGALLGRLADQFLARLQVESDSDVTGRLAGALAFLVDLRLRNGEFRASLDLMRKAEQLQDNPNPEVKERGERLTEALSRAGSDKVFLKLTQMLLEGTDQSSLEAAEILKRGGSRTATYLIERLAEEENRQYRARLVLLLKEMGKGSSSHFVSRLQDPRWFLVRNVVGILGDIGDVGIVAHLRQVLSHGDPRVRREAVRTLMRLGTPECEDLIVSALVDEDKGVQITAVNSLATLKGKRAAGALLDVARKSAPYESIATEVRQESFLGLAKLGHTPAAPLLMEILTRKGFLGRGEPIELRVAAARALGSFGSKEVVALLNDVAANDPKPAVREAAQQALAQRSQAAAQKSR